MTAKVAVKSPQTDLERSRFNRLLYWDGPPPQGLFEGVEVYVGGHAMEIRTIGIDLGKTVFHLVAVDARGEVVARKKCSRTQLLRFTLNLPACLIGMEACAGSHFLGRALREQGHDVRLMPAQYVKPYVKTNKNDFIDAEACSEAVVRSTMRFVPIKTDHQLAAPGARAVGSTPDRGGQPDPRDAARARHHYP
jgi:hypothetical protein